MPTSLHTRPGSGDKCPHCGCELFHASGFRLADVPRLVLLQRPFRCGICLERFFLGFRAVRFSGRSHRIRIKGSSTEIDRTRLTRPDKARFSPEMGLEDFEGRTRKSAAGFRAEP